MLSNAFNVLLNWKLHHISRRVTKSKFLTSPIHLLNRLRLVGAAHVEYSPNLSTHSSQIFEVLYVLVMCLYGLKQLLLLRFAFSVWDDTVAILELQLIRFWILFMSRSRRPIRWMAHDGPRWTEVPPARGWPATSSTGNPADKILKRSPNRVVALSSSSKTSFGSCRCCSLEYLGLSWHPQF
jgi:hypothetical protein